MKSRKKFLVSLLAGLSSLTFTLALASCDISQLQGIDSSQIHTWGELQLTKIPTCTEKGEVSCACTDCEKTLTVSVAELGHDYLLDEENSIEATCETAGKKIEICQRAECGEILETDMPATGHTFVDGVCECGETETTDENIADVSQYLKYTLNEDGQSYSVGFWSSYEEFKQEVKNSGVSTIPEIYEFLPQMNDSRKLKIPSQYNALPITGICQFGFIMCAFSEVEIPDTVTSIGAQAFWECGYLARVIMGKSLNLIGIGAFAHCYSLSDVKIPNSVTSIGDSAFHSCHSLTSVTIPDSVTSIGSSAFYDCNSLTSVVIPDSVTTIGEGAFGGCDNLTSVTIPDSVTSIGDSTFSLCYSLTSVTIPDSVTSIGSSAFAYCHSLTSVVIGDSVTSIGVQAFSHCHSLTSVVIPDSVTSIGDHAFYYCDSLTSVVIPDSVTSIGDSTFSLCYSLTSVTIPDSVTSIGSSAFENCTSLTSVTIPDSVTSIGYSAFAYCDSLTSVTFENTEGWTADSTTISSTDLADTAKATEYLTHTYRDNIWTREE